jgi:hypothetical protein
MCAQIKHLLAKVSNKQHHDSNPMIPDSDPWVPQSDPLIPTYDSGAAEGVGRSKAP